MLVVVAALLLAGCAVEPGGTAAVGAGPGDPPPTASPAPPLPSPPSPTAPPPLPRGEVPVRVTVAAIGLDEELIELGITADGSMEVPQDFSRAGWFAGSGRPGGIGPTVIAGHVDSAVGPAVFFELGALRPGDRFTVTDTRGTVHEYEVYRAEDFAKEAFPTAEVFGATLADEVRLITCSGVFDSGSGHYDDNRVVFAARV